MLTAGSVGNPRAMLDFNRDAAGGEHALGVVARRHRLTNRGRPLGKQAGEQEAGLTWADATGIS